MNSNDTDSSQNPADQGPAEGQNRPVFNPDAPNQQRPRLRPVRGFAAKQGGQVLLGLADAQQLSKRVVFTVPATQVILQHLNGENDIDSIVSSVGRGLTREMLEQLVAQLDDAALIEGPNFDKLLEDTQKEFDSSPHLPPGSTAVFGDQLVMQEHGKEATDEQKKNFAPDLIRKQLDTWMNDALKDAPDPSFDELPKAIVAPHLDYARGWMNYANVYGRMRVVDRPDRIIILGTNHFGRGSGVVGCDKGFETPLGLSPLDADFMHALDRNLDDEQRSRLYGHRYDHENEHSIELQTMWIQHVFGPTESGAHIPVYAALIHDPARNNGDSYDGEGVDFTAFVEALKKALDETPGKTLVVSSADLSHVGPQFGDQKPMAGDDPEVGAMRDKVLKHDHEMLEMFASSPGEELVSSMAWQQNPTRWCSVGNMVAAKKVVEPNEVRILQYTASVDPQGLAMVTSCAAVMV